MNPIGYDFGDTWVEAGGLRFAVRVSTERNLYAPDPARTTVARRGGEVDLAAEGLQWAGGQRKCEGNLRLALREIGDGAVRITGEAAHPDEPLRTIVILIKGMDVCALIGESSNMPTHPLTRERDADVLAWPGREATMPLVFIDCGGRECFALSRDDCVRRKAFSAYWDHLTDEPVLVLAHDEDARMRKCAMRMPAWEVGVCPDRTAVVKRRLSDLESKFGMRPFPEHPERRWVDDIHLVVNLHGVHWTGHVFSTYAQQADALCELAKHIDGRHVLAFLPAWEGAYYRSSPVCGPADEMGGGEGLRALIDAAHALGMRIIPMLDGPNLATDAYLRENGLEAAIMRTASGPLPQDWVDWDGDLSREKLGWIVNYGHPGYREKMVELCCRLIETWGFDGVFLDGAIRWENCADFSPYEGLKAWAEAVRERCPDTLLMAEDGYDLLWDLFGLFATSMQPLGLEQAMLRYTRQTYYLAYPAPGGSGGVHEQAWNSLTKNDRLAEYIIPTLAVVGDTMTRHAEEAGQAAQAAARWRVKRPELADCELRMEL